MGRTVSSFDRSPFNQLSQANHSRLACPRSSPRASRSSSAVEGRRATDTTHREGHQPEDWSTLTINPVTPTQLTYFRLSPRREKTVSLAEKGQHEERNVQYRPVQSWLLFGTPVHVPLSRAFSTIHVSTTQISCTSSKASLAKEATGFQDAFSSQHPEGPSSTDPVCRWVWSRTFAVGKNSKIRRVSQEYHDNGR